MRISDWSSDVCSSDLRERRLDLLVGEDDLRRRSAATEPLTPRRGYKRLYVDHVLQADGGCDFDFLTASGAARAVDRTEERRGGEGWGSTCRYRGSPYH